jgi:hypothetical protein
MADQILRFVLDEKDSDSSGFHKVRLILNPEFFDGRSAGELRSIGMEVAELVPDCAVCSATPDGGCVFSWVDLSFELNLEKP